MIFFVLFLGGVLFKKIQWLSECTIIVISGARGGLSVRGGDSSNESARGLQILFKTKFDWGQQVFENVECMWEKQGVYLRGESPFFA